jgi:two-component system, OmpR family, copper resistance phosphate regulon response regulator CusR
MPVAVRITHTRSKREAQYVGDHRYRTLKLMYRCPPRAGPGPYRIPLMRILIVEDEEKSAAFLSKGLGESGFVADVVRTGEEGVQAALTMDYDLIILDAMLPGKDGWTVLTELRQRGRSMPVLFLTARGEVPDRVKGLELGADDYLVKPYAFTELLARVRALLRRRSERQPDVIQVADLRIDLLGTRAQRGNTRLDLSPKEFALLSLLARRCGEVVPRAVIAEQVWEMHFEGDSNVVDVAVRRLRRKVDDPFPVKLIHTVRGMGYVLDAQ